ncbi:helix-turn-helix domain-containing protein [Pediococcus acidilactici]|uniref:winged helix-turn-helix transcriptional regulator n=1 Tax=Pediococcus acidilactici TaxID=1254 RepID=UPI00254FACB9|nr:helix-turn-helix domain-containing protein [Pediococcus acidilactici]WIL71136.1 helix-turn-helix domain-containing protein [Pediococcus acidilactici]
MQNVHQKTPTDFELCPKFEHLFDILGKKWNGLILEVLTSAGPQRFQDLSRSVTKCSDRVLVERLKNLEEEGLVERCTYQDSSLIEYRLTEEGEGLRPVLEAAHKFADCWY